MDSALSLADSTRGGIGGDFRPRSTDLDFGLFDADPGGLEDSINAGCSPPFSPDLDGLRFKIHFDGLPFALSFDGDKLPSCGGDFGGTLGGISSGLNTGLGSTGTAVVGVALPVGERIGDSGRVVLNVAGGTSSGIGNGHGLAKLSTRGSVMRCVIASPKAQFLQLGALLDRS